MQVGKPPMIVLAKEIKVEGEHNVEMKGAGQRARACCLWPLGVLPNGPVSRQRVHARRRTQTHALRRSRRVARQARERVQGLQGPPQVPVSVLATWEIVMSAPAIGDCLARYAPLNKRGPAPNPHGHVDGHRHPNRPNWSCFERYMGPMCVLATCTGKTVDATSETSISSDKQISTTFLRGARHLSTRFLRDA